MHTINTKWGRITSPYRDKDDPDFTFYLGSHRPNWLNDTPAPLFISAVTLARYRTHGDRWPVRMGCWWAGDSGAFTALTGTNRDHPWWLDPDEYGGMWVRFVEEVGPPDFVAPQDWPCEPIARQRTGATVREHQQWTVENFLYLRENFPMVPWIPVIQGWEPEEYLECAAMYEAAGVDLADEYRVGIGSICRRGSDPDIVRVIQLFADRGYRMHGFGIKTSALRVIGHLLASADSLAWSDTARKERIRLDECEHLGKDGRPSDCRNCFRWALHWRERVLAAVRESFANHPTTPPAPMSNPVPAGRPSTPAGTGPGRPATSVRRRSRPVRSGAPRVTAAPVRAGSATGARPAGPGAGDGRGKRGPPGVSRGNPT